MVISGKRSSSRNMGVGETTSSPEVSGSSTGTSSCGAKIVWAEEDMVNAITYGIALAMIFEEIPKKL